jgi:prefoldin alpha subunit
MNDEELRQAAQALDVYNAQLESLSRQVSLLRATRDETFRAGKALHALAEAKEGDEIIIPVGASAYVKVIVTGKDAICGIGQGISVEKPVAEAADKMDSDRSEVEAALEEALRNVQEIQNYARELGAAVQQEYNQRQANQPR